MLTSNENMVPPTFNAFANYQIFGQMLGFDPLSRELLLPFYLIIVLATLIWLFFDQTLGRFFRCLASICCESKIVVNP